MNAPKPRVRSVVSVVAGALVLAALLASTASAGYSLEPGFGSNGIRSGDYWNLIGIDAAPDGTVVTTDDVRAGGGTGTTGFVKILSGATGALVNQFGTFDADFPQCCGTGGEFIRAFDVAVDTAGSIYVVDVAYYRIQKFTSGGAFVWAIGKDVVQGGGTGAEICTAGGSCQRGLPGSNPGELDELAGIATDPSNNLYVAHCAMPPSGGCDYEIQKFDSAGNFISRWGSTGGLGGQFQFVGGVGDVATDGAGNVYVADYGNHRVEKFDASGTFLLAFGFDVDQGGGTGFETCTVEASCKQGIGGDATGQLNLPQGIDVDSGGRIFIGGGTTSGSRVQRFDPSGGSYVEADRIDDPTDRMTRHLTVDASGSVFGANDQNKIWKMHEVADTDPPSVNVTGKAKTTDRTPKFRFTSDDSTATFKCKLDAKPATTCQSPYQVKKNLSFGSHTFKVTATDPAGNSATDKLTFKVVQP